MLNHLLWYINRNSDKNNGTSEEVIGDESSKEIKTMVPKGG